MKIDITRPVDREQWLETLHVKGNADSRLMESLQEAERILLKEAGPKAVYRLMDRQLFHSEGFSIEKHLEGCHKVIIMGLTLGSGVDSLIRRTQITDMPTAVLIDAGASVLIDQLADEYQRYICDSLAETEGGVGNIYTTSRFSPGYGDYPVTEQMRVLRYLDAGRKIGLTVTAESLMVPRKSITAVMGLSDRPVTGRPATCGECVLKDKCELRKEGKFCGD